MTDCTCFSVESGEITHIMSGDGFFIIANCAEDESWVEGHYARETHYIDLTDPDNPTPAERPASPVSRTDLTLLDVPAGSTLWINGVSYPAEGTVDLEFTYPGTYSLRVECFPFLNWVMR